jgi:hypothetical protein
MHEKSTVSIMTLIIRGPLFSTPTPYLGAKVASRRERTPLFFAPWPLRNT